MLNLKNERDINTLNPESMIQHTKTQLKRLSYVVYDNVLYAL